MAHPFRWRPGGLRSLAAPVRRYPHRLTAPTERAPSRGSASNGPSVSVQAGNGPSVSAQAWRAAVPRSPGSPISTPPHAADGAGALQGIGRQWPIRFGAALTNALRCRRTVLVCAVLRRAKRGRFAYFALKLALMGPPPRAQLLC